MNCEQAREHLIDRLDGTLPPERDVALSEHVQVCPDCREELEALREAEAAARSLPRVQAPPDFMDRLRAALDAEAAAPAPNVIRPARWPAVPKLASAAAVLLVATGLFALYSNLQSGARAPAPRFGVEKKVGVTPAPSLAAGPGPSGIAAAGDAAFDRDASAAARAKASDAYRLKGDAGRFGGRAGDTGTALGLPPEGATAPEAVPLPGAVEPGVSGVTRRLAKAVDDTERGRRGFFEARDAEGGVRGEKGLSPPEEKEYAAEAEWALDEAESLDRAAKRVKDVLAEAERRRGVANGFEDIAKAPHPALNLMCVKLFVPEAEVRITSRQVADLLRASGSDVIEAPAAGLYVVEATSGQSEAILRGVSLLGRIESASPGDAEGTRIVAAVDALRRTQRADEATIERAREAAAHAAREEARRQKAQELARVEEVEARRLRSEEAERREAEEAALAAAPAAPPSAPPAPASAPAAPPPAPAAPASAPPAPASAPAGPRPEPTAPPPAPPGEDLAGPAELVPVPAAGEVAEGEEAEFAAGAEAPPAAPALTPAAPPPGAEGPPVPAEAPRRPAREESVAPGSATAISGTVTARTGAPADRGVLASDRVILLIEMRGEPAPAAGPVPAPAPAPALEKARAAPPPAEPAAPPR